MYKEKDFKSHQCKVLNGLRKTCGKELLEGIMYFLE